jgi:site-specific DNA recombinase
MRILGYARVSSELQAKGSSLGDQQEAIRAYAVAKGRDVARFYVEAESAVHEKIERREQIRALLRDVRKGDLVLCDKLDRWSRDPEFTYKSVRELLQAGASFYAVGDACDPSTPEGDTALGFRVLFAREEHKRIKQRMVGTRQLLRDRGYYVEGTPPFGYRRAQGKGYKGVEKNILVIVPDEADVVRRVFRRYLRGQSMQRVGDELGLELWDVKRILDRRTYVGEVQNSRGEWIKGHHEPIIDAATFTKAREAADARRLGGARPRNAPARTDGWILRDVARCGHCGARMAAAYGPAHVYYRCTHRCLSKGTRANAGSYVLVESVEEPARMLVVKRLASLRQELARMPQNAPAVVDLEAKREKLQRKRERFQEAYADGSMTRDELRAAMLKLDAERLKLDAEEAEQHKPRQSKAERREALRVVAALKDAFNEASKRRQRQIVNQLVDAMHITNGALPAPTWKADLDIEALAASLVNDS